VFNKLKEKIISSFSKTKQYIILCSLDSYMFRTLDHHQAIFIKLSIRYMQCQKNSCNIESNKIYKCIKMF